MSKELSYESWKKLYIQKMQAIQKNDKAFLVALHQQYPELFDKCFLYQILQKAFEINSLVLPAHLDKTLTEIINSQKTH